MSVRYIEAGKGERIACRGSNGTTYCGQEGKQFRNCSDFCSYVEASGILDTSYDAGINPVAYYAKCHLSTGGQAPNGRMFQFVSQLGTTEIDPSLPQTNPASGNNTCIGIVSLNFSKFFHKLKF